MEIKLPREIRKYTESIFMGLNLKQCIMSSIAIALAIPIFISLRPSLGLEGAAWVCVIIVAPIAATAFIKIKNLPLLEYVIAFVKWFLTRNPLVNETKNTYMDAITKMRFEKKKAFKPNLRFKSKEFKKGVVIDEQDEIDS